MNVLSILELVCRRITNRGRILLACVASGAIFGCAEPSKQLGFREAGQMFESRGVQPRQSLPQLSLVSLDGEPVSIREIQAGRPLVLVTASLTCNVARRNQATANQIAQQFGGAVAVVVVYTIEAHPKGDVCPYTGSEWVPQDNERDDVLVRQPTDLSERLAFARQYQQRFGTQAVVLVDTMDNKSWEALGKAPNVGLLVDGNGVVQFRQGWFDAEGMKAALANAECLSAVNNNNFPGS